MGNIIVEGGQSVEIWESSSLMGDRMCGDRTECLLEISDGRGSMRVAITGFMRKQREEISNKVNI